MANNKTVIGLLKFLYFMAVAVIVILPVAGSILSLKNTTSTHHTTIINGIKCHEAHINNEAHTHHWDMVKNKQLSRPPAPVKVRTLTAISLLFTIAFLGLSLPLCRLKQQYFAGHITLLPVRAKYLHNRMLLI